MIENIRLSFQGIWSHKMRSFLTMLGIIIGIAAVNEHRVPIAGDEGGICLPDIDKVDGKAAAFRYASRLLTALCGSF